MVAKKKVPVKAVPKTNINEIMQKLVAKIAKIETFLLNDPQIAPRYIAYMNGEVPKIGLAAPARVAAPQPTASNELSEAEIEALLRNEMNPRLADPKDPYATQDDIESAFL